MYAVLATATILGFTSFAVDWGKMLVARAELQTVADASALAAIAQLPNLNHARLVAIDTACENATAGCTNSVTTDDVVIGRWDTQAETFTAGNQDANAVRVIAARSAARGNAVQPSLAQAIGIKSLDVSTHAIAFIDHPDTHGIVGLDYFRAQGVLTVNSYPTQNRAQIASNGDITLNLLGLIGITSIKGDAQPGIGKQIKKPLIGFLTNITGNTAPLTHTLNYPKVVADKYITTNDNAHLPNLSNRDFTAAILTDVPAGTYYVDDFTLLANVLLRINGPTTFYVTGKTTILGSVLVASNDAANFRIRVIGDEPVDLVANTAIYCDLYAPESPIRITAGVGYFGGLIGKSIDILATSFIFYDERLGPPGGLQPAMLVD